MIAFQTSNLKPPFFSLLGSEPKATRKRLRVLAMLFAVFMTALYARVCFGPLHGSIGPLRYHFSNPFKVIAVTVLALQIWWLLTPRAESLLLRRSGFTWWQMKLAIEATELCIVAIIGVLVTDLQWSGGPVVELLRPTAAIELALLAAAIVIVSTG